MSKLEYWRESLGNAIPYVALTDKQIEDIMSIAEMESEYCGMHEGRKEPESVKGEEIVIRQYSTCCNGVVVPSKGSYMGEILYVCDRCRKYLSQSQIRLSRE